MANDLEIYQSSLTAEQMEQALLNQVPRMNESTGHWETWNVIQMRWDDTGISYQGLTLSLIEYGVSDDAETMPDEWSEELPVVSQGQVLWTRLTWSDESYSYTYAIQGKDGADGEDGTTIESVEYGQSASASTEPATWQSTMPIVPQGQYLWTRINYTDGTSSKTYSRQGVDGTGVGDMTKADYDANGDVLSAGGIAEYVEKSDGFMGWGKSKNIVFNADGSITETSGDYTRQTVFNGNVITETVKKNGTTIITKTTTFNNDGSISEVIV